MKAIWKGFSEEVEIAPPTGGVKLGIEVCARRPPPTHTSFQLSQRCFVLRLMKTCWLLGALPVFDYFPCRTRGGGRERTVISWVYFLLEGGQAKASACSCHLGVWAGGEGGREVVGKLGKVASRWIALCMGYWVGAGLQCPPNPLQRCPPHKPGSFQTTCFRHAHGLECSGIIRNVKWTLKMIRDVCCCNPVLWAALRPFPQRPPQLQPQSANTGDLWVCPVLPPQV